MLDLDLSTLSRTLKKNEAGIWTVAGHQGRESDDDAVSYPEGGNEECFQLEDDSFWFAHRNECISSALKRYPFDGPFLDIGGGNGVVSHRLVADGIDTVVLEPGAAGASNARKRGLSNVVCATLEEAAFEPSAFGAAGLFDVIEHVEDDEAILRSTRTILRRGGVLCVTVPAYRFLWSDEDESAGHYRRYTLRGLRSVLERARFDVRYGTYFFAPLAAPLFFMRSLRSRLGLRSAKSSEAAREHVPSPIVRRTLETLLAPERKRIAGGRTMPFGTSCLMVALAK